MPARPRTVFALTLILFTLPIAAEDSATIFRGKWSWTVIGSSKVEYRFFDGIDQVQKLIVTENPLDLTTTLTVDPTPMRYFVTPDVKLLTIRFGTGIVVYQYEFLSKDRVLLTDTSTIENPTKIFLQFLQN